MDPEDGFSVKINLFLMSKEIFGEVISNKN